MGIFSKCEFLPLPIGSKCVFASRGTDSYSDQGPPGSMNQILMIRQRPGF
jgi:hypothetical protein